MCLHCGTIKVTIFVTTITDIASDIRPVAGIIVERVTINVKV